MAWRGQFKKVPIEIRLMAIKKNLNATLGYSLAAVFPAGTSKPEARAFERRSQTHEYGAAKGTATMGRQHRHYRKEKKG